MYEYKVIPAPRTAPRIKGTKNTTERFAAGFQTALNELGVGGWSFVRAETLPVDERHGLWRKSVEEFHTVLIFRRPLTHHSGPEVKADPHQPRFFSHREPAEAHAPALGAATEAGAKTTPELRAKKEPAEEKPAKPPKRRAGWTPKKTAE